MYCFGFVGDRNVYYAISYLHVHRSYFFGTEYTQSAAFDHRGTAHSDIRSLGRDYHVAASEQCGVAGKASARVDSHERHQAAQFSPVVERHAVESRDAQAVGVAGASAAAFGEEDHRQARLLRDFEHPVFLAMVLLALRAGEHGVVVRHQDALRLGFLEQIAVDASDPRDHSVGRRVLHQVFDRAPSPLRRDHQRTVLDEGAGIAQVVDIFASGALPGLAPARDRVGPRGVESERMTLDHFRKIRTHAIQIHLAGLGALRRLDVGLLDKASGCPSKIASPLATVMRRTIPLLSAAMTCSIFIASMTNSCWPRCTRSPSLTSTETIVPCIGASIATVFSGAVMSCACGVTTVVVAAIGDGALLSDLP